MGNPDLNILSTEHNPCSEVIRKTICKLEREIGQTEDQMIDKEKKQKMKKAWRGKGTGKSVPNANTSHHVKGYGPLSSFFLFKFGEKIRNTDTDGTSPGY